LLFKSRQPNRTVPSGPSTTLACCGTAPPGFAGRHAVAERIQGIFLILQLRLQAAQNLKIAAQLSGHLADVLRIELPNPSSCRPGSCAPPQLALQKLGCAFRLLLAHFKILVDK